MFQRMTYLTITLGLICTGAQAQRVPTAPSERDIYCAGVVTTEPLASDFYVISGPGSDIRIGYQQGNFVFLNRGASQGVRVGNQFLVSRPVSERLQIQWFKWQTSLMRAMGQAYADIGRLRVVAVQPSISIAEIISSCSVMERGDLVQPFVERPAPPYKPAEKFDPFAPSSGKAKAMVVTTSVFGQIAGTGATVYVNLGSAQGTKVGDYFRIFRYQGEHDETVYQTRGTAYRMYGLGATPVAYTWSDLPRDVLGEGIVVRVAPNAATVLVTLSQREIYAGDYVELE